MPIRRNAEQLI